MCPVLSSPLMCYAELTDTKPMTTRKLRSLKRYHDSLPTQDKKRKTTTCIHLADHTDLQWVPVHTYVAVVMEGGGWTASNE